METPVPGKVQSCWLVRCRMKTELHPFLTDWYRQGNSTQFFVHAFHVHISYSEVQASEEKALSVHNNDRTVLKDLCNTKASTGGAWRSTLMCHCLSLPSSTENTHLLQNLTHCHHTTPARGREDKNQ